MFQTNFKLIYIDISNHRLYAFSPILNFHFLKSTVRSSFFRFLFLLLLTYLLWLRAYERLKFFCANSLMCFSLSIFFYSPFILTYTYTFRVLKFIYCAERIRNSMLSNNTYRIRIAGSVQNRWYRKKDVIENTKTLSPE